MRKYILFVISFLLLASTYADERRVSAAGRPVGVVAIQMGAPFSDHAVLQRGMKVPVWGTAMPSANVVVSFAGQTKTGTADDSGRWRVTLEPMEASKEGRTMTISSSASNLHPPTFSMNVEDVLVGEVWFASGQSNMECPVWGPSTRFRDANGALVVAMTRMPLVRYCRNEHKWSVKPVALKSAWRELTPENVRAAPFSAVAYYYARELHIALDVPIGIVESSMGGTNIDAWTPRCGYEDCDETIAATAAYKLKEKAAWDDKTDRRWPVIAPHQQPTVLWNGMIDAWAPMAMRGFIWYQGCHNNGPHERKLYYSKLRALYNGWSRAFANSGLKMYLAQLAPCDQNWMGIADAQLRFVREQPNAAVAATADAGNFDDVHPNKKEVVARRLAVHALKRDYGFDIPEDDSPVLERATFADGKAELTFSHVKGWYLYADDCSMAPPFELAGTNGVWHAAKIANLRIGYDRKKKADAPQPYVDGPKIVLTSDEVAEPIKARYMGKDRTMGTAYNEMSLPLGPFEVRMGE